MGERVAVVEVRTEGIDPEVAVYREGELVFTGSLLGAMEELVPDVMVYQCGLEDLPEFTLPQSLDDLRKRLGY